MSSPNKIGLQTIALQEKIKILKDIAEALTSETKITALKFGARNMALSKCQSATEMEMLNSEYALVADSLAGFVKATIQFLEKTSATFIRVSNANSE